MTGHDPRLVQVLEQLAEVLPVLLAERRGASTATVNATVSAGGFGVWIATTCCLVCLAGYVALGLHVSKMQDDIAALEQADREKANFLAAIYAQAPHLRPQQEPTP